MPISLPDGSHRLIERMLRRLRMLVLPVKAAKEPEEQSFEGEFVAVEEAAF